MKVLARQRCCPSVSEAVQWRSCSCFQWPTESLITAGLSKAETQALTNYGSGEDENDEEEVEEFAAGPVDVQTSLQASANGQEVGGEADRTASLALAR